MEIILSGAIAGTAVDTILYPLDTIKTRLQSVKGFRSSGGFNGIYRGLSSAILGSAPSAAAFFTTYEYSKNSLYLPLPLVHMISASFGELSACLIRVPTEVIKQRMQTRVYSNVLQAISTIFKNNGILGFYQGYTMTLFREIPFTCIQFPLYEYLKSKYKIKNNTINAFDAGICGSISGGVAAAVTTPLDVLKTRIMLQTHSEKSVGIYKTFIQVYSKEGFSAFFKGIVPRVLWISIGGSIFLGAYEASLNILRTL